MSAVGKAFTTPNANFLLKEFLPPKVTYMLAHRNRYTRTHTHTYSTAHALCDVLHIWRTDRQTGGTDMEGIPSSEAAHVLRICFTHTHTE